jgi:fructan beta-fructosidase
MMRFFIQSFLLFLTISGSCLNSNAQNLISKDTIDNEKLYRPYIHFTPKTGWMNDPNGMFFQNGVYHLYYQFYPNATIWGPMHWGHATSKDLIHWEHKPIAIYPDNLGLIFSGSAVVDKNNTSGLGTQKNPAIVAIFTQHSMEGEKAGKNNFQNQSIAYSNDGGNTWKMYTGNPVIKNPGINDFRDPKVIWHEPTKRWIMALAVKNKVSLYSSANLKEWEKESDFGELLGNHEGVWECPDLFQMSSNGKNYWVLSVSVNPGGPNKGSATQYFVGDFDGHQFNTNSNKTKWLDYGTDNYAGVTWSNTGNRKIAIGWMSNWLYAQQVPTNKWRSAMTIARELGLQEIGEEMYVSSMPVKELKFYKTSILSDGPITPTSAYELNIQGSKISSFTITLQNEEGESLDFGYDQETNQYFIDRSFAGLHDFHKEFAALHSAPRISTNANFTFKVLIDKTSIEIFADYGLTVMTDIFFPKSPYSSVTIQSANEELRKSVKISSFLAK